MHPVSKERVEWVKARLKLLDEMFNELRDRPTKYLSSDVNAPLSPALTAIGSERLVLRVELEVLSQLYKE